MVYENVTFFRSILVGAMFGFAWTPCVGPMLTSILALAATLETVKQGGLLLFFYAVGYSTPFIVMSFFARSVMPFIKKMGKYLPMIKIATGVILIIIGLDILGFGVFHLDHDHDHENEASYENGIDLEEKTGIFENDVAKEIYFTNGEDLFFKLSDFRGKKVVLNFFATWCPPCMMELPELSAYYEEMKSVEDLEFIFLDLYAEEAGLSKSEIERFLADKEIRLNLFFDDEGIANETYGVAYIPTTLLIDENGKILLRKTGMIEVDEIKGIFSK